MYCIAYIFVTFRVRVTVRVRVRFRFGTVTYLIGGAVVTDGPVTFFGFRLDGPVASA